MIPLQLTLKNFLSYREVTLNFRGLHTACICGPNGAGKSSLLEGIAWALWGESRVATEEDVIHLGEKEAQADYWFELHGQTYRVLRTRIRGQATALEFQVLIETGFKSLTGRGVRATQDLIIQHLKLDYETFINSAYLRQGRADEFMLKRPSERKQILADLLKLDHYDQLAEQAKDRAKSFKAKVDLLEQSLSAIAEQLQTEDTIAAEKTHLAHEITQIRQSQTDLQTQRQTWQQVQQQRQTWQQERHWHQQQQQTTLKAQRQVEQDIEQIQAQQDSLKSLLKHEAQIIEGYTHWQRLQQDEEVQTQRSETFQSLQSQYQQRVQQQTQQVNALTDQRRQVMLQLKSDQQQEQELTPLLAKAPEVESALQNLQAAKEQLAQLDQVQIQVSPLQQRRTALQTQIDRIQAKLMARIDELTARLQTFRIQQRQRPDLEAVEQQITAQIEALDKRRVYHQRVREKGLERRAFMEQLQTQVKDYEQQLQALETQNHPTIGTTCPLCESPLDEDHWQRIMAKHRAEQADLRGQIWVVREQLAVSDREIHILRQEYHEVGQELAPYGSLLERRGQVLAQIQAIADSEIQSQQLEAELQVFQLELSTGTYAAALQSERSELDAQLQALNYDERNHALARGEVERWRWAEIKQSELRQAQQKLTTLRDRRPQLEQQLQIYQDQIDQLLGQGAFEQSPSPIQQQIQILKEHLHDLNYDPAHHSALRGQVRQAQVWQWRYQELQQAQQQLPQLQQRLAQLQQAQQTYLQTQQQLTETLQTLIQQLQDTPDPSPQLVELDQHLQAQHQALESALAHQGRLQQQALQLATLKTQQQKQQQEIQHCQYQYRIYQELGQAFGKNGIQALMIENVLPQLEVEANQILNRLSGSQLHIQFVTQKASRREQTRGKRSPQSPTKLIDTLDILIADLSGTRPYETYSGGESFRVNFAIRLALARLLAQRSGTALQMLIIDEGFGTQDPDGCDRLIAAINAIAPDFACILVVTHMPHLKEAFQTRVEVLKTATGSQLTPVF